MRTGFRRPRSRMTSPIHWCSRPQCRSYGPVRQSRTGPRGSAKASRPAGHDQADAAGAASAQPLLLGLLQLLLDGVKQLLPGLLELLDTFALQHREDVVDVDAGLAQVVEHLLGLRSGAAHRVPADVRVVGD